MTSMDKFQILLDKNKVAEQIAALLNTYNRLTKLHTSHSILSSNTHYLIKEGVLNNICIIGCLGVDVLTNDSIYLKHLSTHIAFRKQGVATDLIQEAQKIFYRYKYIYMNIRSDNYASLKLAEKEGFLINNIKPQYGYNIVTVGKINDKYS